MSANDVRFWFRLLNGGHRLGRVYSEEELQKLALEEKRRMVGEVFAARGVGLAA